MLHLAQVKKNPTSGEMELQFLASQHSEYCWEVSNLEVLPWEEVKGFSDGLLALVELDENRQIIKIKNAKDWVIYLIQNYLADGIITPDFVQQEQARIEEWRQEMTSKSLDLTRRQLELETQREQLQELETSLKQEQESLEMRWQKLQGLESKTELKNQD